MRVYNWKPQLTEYPQRATEFFLCGSLCFLRVLCGKNNFGCSYLVEVRNQRRIAKEALK